jgi:small conductance mechanosensitive channel
MRRLVFSLLLPVVALVICAQGARAQLIPGVPASPAPPAKQMSLFQTAQITVDGVPLFKVAAPADPQPGTLSAQTRALIVQNAIAQVLATEPVSGKTAFDLKTFKVSVERQGDQYVLVARDGAGAPPVPLVTVTTDDARQAMQTDSAVAAQWRALLQTALEAALLKRQPDELRRNGLIVAQIAGVLLVAGVLGMLALTALDRQRRRLEDAIEAGRREAQAALAAADADASAGGEKAESLAQRLLDPERQKRWNRLLAASIVWVLVAVFIAAATYGLMLFPVTTQYGLYLLHASGRVAFIWIAAFVIDRILVFVIPRISEAYVERGASSEDRARFLLRAPTIAQALSGFKTLTILFVAILATLGVLNIPIASVVTIGGIAAVAVGFASQSLVRDFTGGLLVLFEDQYAVGDSVQIGNYNGMVENLTLRIVQIRDSKGRLITIPHGTVTQVVNNSRSWSRIDYRVAVAAGTNPDDAMSILRDTIEAMAGDEAWRGDFINPVEWIGVEAVWQQGVVLRASIRTAPLRQYELQRAINRRLIDSFGAAGIKFGLDPDAAPQLSITASPDPT